MYYFAIITFAMMPCDDPGETNRPCLRAGRHTCVGGHAIAPAKSYKSGVYDSGGTSYLSCFYGSYVPRPSGGIHCGVLNVL
jgi:hypothetical protein